MSFDREEPGFRQDAAIRGEAADPAAGRDHPMARHDDRERVSCESLPNGARRARDAGTARVDNTTIKAVINTAARAFWWRKLLETGAYATAEEPKRSIRPT
jgi:hypothetical protein